MKKTVRSSVAGVLFVILALASGAGATANQETDRSTERFSGTYSFRYSIFCDIMTLTFRDTGSGTMSVTGIGDVCGYYSNAGVYHGAAIFSPNGTLTLGLGYSERGFFTQQHFILSPVTGNGNFTDSLGRSGRIFFFRSTEPRGPVVLPRMAQ